MESPHHPSCGISLLLVYAVSIPIHPGIETAWAGMENPTSVKTQTHSSLALKFGQRAAILTEVFQENLTSTLPLPVSTYSVPSIPVSLLPQEFTFESWVC